MSLLWFDLVFHWARISSACSPDEIRGIVFPDFVSLHPGYVLKATQERIVLCAGWVA